MPLTLDDHHRVRMLPAEEWHRLGPLFADSFPTTTLPSPPPLSHAIVIERDDEIMSAMFFRQEFHMEPFCARKGYGHFFPTMVEALESVIRETVLSPGGELYYFCTAPNREEQIAREEALGRVVAKEHLPVIGVVRA